jgi:hypothetical protein
MRCSPRASLLAGLFMLPACGGTTSVPASVVAPTGEPAVAPARPDSPDPALGARCDAEAGCAAGAQCAAVDIIPHTGVALRTCEQPCATDADCDGLVPEAERACVVAARAATGECQCTPGTSFVRCVATADDPPIRICDRRATFQDYGRPRCR